MKTSLILIALAMVAGFAAFFILGWRSDELVAVGLSEVSQDLSFEVRVVRPRIARPLFGILPLGLEEKLRGDDAERFDHASPGATLGIVGPGRLDLSADGWDLSIEADEEGRVAPGSRLVFPFAVGGRLVDLRCRPADPAVGYLRTTPRSASNTLDGSFLVELTTCENARTGKPVDWPPAPPRGLPPQPLRVRGSFEGLLPTEVPGFQGISGILGRSPTVYYLVGGESPIGQLAPTVVAVQTSTGNTGSGTVTFFYKPG